MIEGPPTPRCHLPTRPRRPWSPTTSRPSAPSSVATLTRSGYDVAETSDGTVAGQLLGGQDFAVAVLDCEMPGWSGPDGVAGAGIRVPGSGALVSGAETAESIPGLAGDPLAAFLPKPLRVSDLLDAIARLLAGRSPT